MRISRRALRVDPLRTRLFERPGGTAQVLARPVLRDLCLSRSLSEEVRWGMEWFGEDLPRAPIVRYRP
jgi:hypothetical protein